MVKECNSWFCTTENGVLCDVTSLNEAGDADLESLSAGNGKEIFLHKRTLAQCNLALGNAACHRNNENITSKPIMLEFLFGLAILSSCLPSKK